MSRLGEGDMALWSQGHSYGHKPSWDATPIVMAMCYGITQDSLIVWQPQRVGLWI